jgi:uncharacterized protein YdhG (YjbR/CyaY superfamily)
MKKTQRTCPQGHHYWKSSDCPTCPECEQELAPQEDWLSLMSAPARRALEREGLTDLKALSNWSEKELLALHGIGPTTIPVLRSALHTTGSHFKKERSTMDRSNNKPQDTDEYLEQLPTDQAKALQKLRKQIIAASPKCEEYLGYGLPGFKYNGHPLLYIGAAKHHCALYGTVPKGFEEALKDFKRSKGAVQFTPKKLIPAAVVKAIVKEKMEEIVMRWPEDHARI